MKSKLSFLPFLDPEILESKKSTLALGFNFVILISQLLYTFLRYNYMNPQIPLWYTRPWGDYQLSNSLDIFIIPIVSLILIIATAVISNILYKLKSKEGVFISLIFLTISVSFLFLSEIRIVERASAPYPEIISRQVTQLLPLAVISFLLCAGIVPWVIKFAKKYNLVTDPSKDKHPGMILKKPSARAGGVAFFIAFLIIGILFVPVNRAIAGLYIGGVITTFIGLWDDKKNLNPYLRLGLLSIAIVATLIVSNVHIYFFADPFDGIIRLDKFQIPLILFGIRFVFIPIADIFTLFWILWLMNMLSWSNGVDGQFSGTVAITCIITALLSLRLLKMDPWQLNVAKLAAIAAGASLGILPYNWHPSKIMWGFGATTIGLLIGILSILAGTKVAVATFALIVPTLDAVITMLRRILQKKSPVWGDRGHLHHRLLDLGFQPPEIAVFYWILTALFGVIAMISSGREKILALITVGGLISFILVILNLKGELGKLKQ